MTKNRQNLSGYQTHHFWYPLLYYAVHRTIPLRFLCSVFKLHFFWNSYPFFESFFWFFNSPRFFEILFSYPWSFFLLFPKTFSSSSLLLQKQNLFRFSTSSKLLKNLPFFRFYEILELLFFRSILFSHPFCSDYKDFSSGLFLFLLLCRLFFKWASSSNFSFYPWNLLCDP